jgi:hypothetical protein
LVERLVGKLKQFRRVATRYDKLAAHYLAFVRLTSAIIWLRSFGDTALPRVPHGISRSRRPIGSG